MFGYAATFIHGMLLLHHRQSAWPHRSAGVSGAKSLGWDDNDDICGPNAIAVQWAVIKILEWNNGSNTEWWDDYAVTIAM